MKITFTVEVEVDRITGKFAAKADIAEAIRDELESAAEGADVCGHDVDGDSEYEVVGVSVEVTS